VGDGFAAIVADRLGIDAGAQALGDGDERLGHQLGFQSRRADDARMEVKLRGRSE
jgi:hypothetical protein